LIYLVSNSFVNEKEVINATVKECLDYFKDHEWIGVDTETEGFDPHVKKILTLQLGDSDNQWVIDCRTIKIQIFKELLESKKLILHNSKFDYKFLKTHGIYIENIYDTFLAELIIYCGYVGFGFGLANLTERYCGIKLSKEERGSFFKLNSNTVLNLSQIMYASKDVKYLHSIKDQQMAKIKKYDLEYCLNLECQAIKALADIELNGMTLDSNRWLKNSENYEAEAEEFYVILDNVVKKDPILSRIYRPKFLQTNLFGFKERELDINYSSPKQIKDLLSHLGITIESTDERNLKKVVHRHSIIPILLELRKLEKVISTYGKDFLKNVNKNTHKIHTNFWPILVTGRVSSSEPNLQNIPKTNQFRNCFIAQEGYKIVSCDYSAQELRLMAEGSNEQGFIDVMNRGDDLHCFVGSMMFQKTITKEDKDLRNKAKTINFGKPYGMSPIKLSDLLQIPIEEADMLFKKYAEAFPSLDSWLVSQAKFAVENLHSRSFAPCKRIRWYPELKEAYLNKSTDWKQFAIVKGNTERNGMNQPIQASGADICKEALVEGRKLCKQYNEIYGNNTALMICTVHDEIDFEVKNEYADQFGNEITSLMIEVGNKYVTKVNMDVETTITDFWTK